MTPEEAFFKAWGRAPTRVERDRIRRLQAAFAIDENDALLTIAMVLEFYDGQFRLYPGQCAEGAATAVQRWLASPEGTALLSRALRAASPERELPARVLASAPADVRSNDARRELYWVYLGGLATASSAMAGALGMIVGAVLSGRHPCWVPRDAASSLAANLIGAPMGWVLFIGLLVPAQNAAAWAWRRGRDERVPMRDRWIGWGALAGVTFSVVSWAVLVLRLVLSTT
jgi:fermentation-respiration switch protein FrsA (DUF1100 family)